MGVYARGSKLWIRFRDVGGKWRDASTGYAVGQEALAQATHDEVVARVAASERTVKHAPARGLTVRAFAADWIVKRRERDLDWKGDQGRLKHHVLPELGELPIADVRARHLVDLFHKLRTDKDRPLAPKTIYNVYACCSAMFRDARLAELIEQSPCILDERQLGPRIDSDPEWRKDVVFSRTEAETLISDHRIPLDRQMVYGLELLAGVRTGEASALRWRHYDPVVRPLGKLLVARSYNSRTGREKNTKTEAVKHVPVHPTLAAMLAEWKLGGWPELMGRAPGPDDLIVPLPRTRPIGAVRAPASRTAQPATRGSTGGRPTPGARLAAPAALRHARHVHHARDRGWGRPGDPREPRHARSPVAERVRRLQPRPAMGADVRRGGEVADRARCAARGCFGRRRVGFAKARCSVCKL